jgi:hypothetical protein
MADKPASSDEIHQLAGFLRSQGVVHAFIGGVAMGAWGVPRGTFDLDVVIASTPDEVLRLLASIPDQGWVVDPIFASGFRDRLAGMEKIHMQLPVGSTLLTVDMFLDSTPFLHSVLDRRVSIDLGHGPIHVCTAADLILLKLIAGRPKDLLDIENLHTIQGLPDGEYLTRWANELGVRKRLELLLEGS